MKAELKEDLIGEEIRKLYKEFGPVRTIKFFKLLGISKGDTLRELIVNGRLMLAIKLYKEKKISIGKASELAGISISEMIDTLSKFGLSSNISSEDFKESLRTARKLKFN